MTFKNTNTPDRTIIEDMNVNQLYMVEGPYASHYTRGKYSMYTELNS